MRTSGLLFAVSAAASLTFLLARPLTAGDWPVIFKVLSILLLAVLGFRVDGLLGGGLALSSLGDFLLGIRRLGSLDGESLFLLGLGSFLIAHLIYIALFRKYPALVWWKPSPRVWGVLAILLAIGSVLGILQRSLGSMLIPVVVYSLVLSCMGISAMLADLGTPLAGFGALLFIASDAMIAINRFRGPFPGNEQLIWITYYSAQFLILRGVGRRHSRKQRAP
ncbi:MAG: lysoplasmalogenase [Acidobacteriia bacterium]|nr:lysoplasmalogenase [Terriglobia bacterium]